MKYSLLFWLFTAAIGSLTVAAPQAFANQRQNILDLVTGSWIASGNSFGSNVRSEMEWTEILDGHFYRIDYRINRDPAGDETFIGTGHYKATSSSNTNGYWADNSGDLHPLRVQLKDDVIISHWGVAGEKQGRTEYRLTRDERLSVTDWLLTSEGWQQFNQSIFERKPL